jgi:hypothetical protein
MKRILLIAIVSLFTKSGLSQCSVQIALNSIHCSGAGNNSLIANATGQAPFSYLWSTGDTTAITDSINLWPVYTVTVTDNAGCVASDTANVFPQVSTFNVTNISCPGCCDGSITATLSPSLCTPTYYIWYGAIPYTYTGVPSISGLCAGGYTLMVNTNCGSNCQWTCGAVSVSGNATGISEPDTGMISTVIYPNPSSGSFQLSNELIQTADEVIISSMTGEEVKRICIGSEKEQKIELENGIYLLKVRKGNTVLYTDKLVITRE